MAIYFLSDTHFGDRGIIKHERTQFKTTEEHDDYIIKAINEQVKPTDELWILGDIGRPEALRLVNGRKYLIRGNHDKRTDKEYLGYFAAVYNTPVYLNQRIVLSHYPIPVTEGTLNVHGHLHGSMLATNNHLNVSFHMINYRPLAMTSLNNKLGLLEADKNKFLEEWFADLYLFTTERTDVVTDSSGCILLKESLELRKKLYETTPQ